MTKTYGATNPQQIIDLFEMRAKIAEQGNGIVHTFEEAGAAKAWRAAADILRNTEFVGWSHDTRIVDTITGHDTLREAIFDEIKPPRITVIEHREELVSQSDLMDDDYARDVMKIAPKDPIEQHLTDRNRADTLKRAGIVDEIRPRCVECGNDAHDCRCGC